MSPVQKTKRTLRKSEPPDGDRFINAWKRFVYGLASSQTLCISGVRKIVTNAYWEISLQDLYSCQVEFEDLSYKEAKFKQLVRNYWDEDSIAAAMAKVKERKDMPHTSVAFQLKNGEKDVRSQGYCMQNLVLTTTKYTCEMDIFYRSTEALQKFLADLIFFKKMFPGMLAQAGVEPTVIRFHFANAYLSAMFLPILFRFDETPEEFFKELAKDEKFNRTCRSATSKFFQPSHSYTYQKRVIMFEYAKNNIPPERYKLLADILKGEKPMEFDDVEDES